MVAAQTGRKGRVHVDGTILFAIVVMLAVVAVIAALSLSGVFDDDTDTTQEVLPKAVAVNGAGDGLVAGNPREGTSPNVSYPEEYYTTNPTDRGAIGAGPSLGLAMPKAHFIRTAGEGIGAGYSREALAPVTQFSDMQFIEDNTQLPTGTIARGETRDETTFRENNGDLVDLNDPTSVVVPPLNRLTWARIHFMEANMLPGDDVAKKVLSPRVGPTEH